MLLKKDVIKPGFHVTISGGTSAETRLYQVLRQLRDVFSFNGNISSLCSTVAVTVVLPQ